VLTIESVLDIPVRPLYKIEQSDVVMRRSPVTAAEKAMYNMYRFLRRLENVCKMSDSVANVNIMPRLVNENRTMELGKTHF